MFGINKEEKKLKKELKLEKTLTSISGLTRLPDETHEEFVARVNAKRKFKRCSRNVSILH